MPKIKLKPFAGDNNYETALKLLGERYGDNKDSSMNIPLNF